jgi:hypothetical protein
MGKSLNLKIAGLFTSQNDYGTKQGMLDVANNVVIDQQDLAQCRKGFDALAHNLPDTNDRISRFGVYQDTLVAHYGTNILAYYDSNTGWVPYSGTFDHPDADTARCRFLQSNLNLYITTSLGIKKLDFVTGTPADAGIPKALDLAVSLTGSSGFLTSNVVKTISAKATSGSAILTYISDEDIAKPPGRHVCLRHRYRGELDDPRHQSFFDGPCHDRYAHGRQHEPNERHELRRPRRWTNCYRERARDKYSGRFGERCRPVHSHGRYCRDPVGYWRFTHFPIR